MLVLSVCVLHGWKRERATRKGKRKRERKTRMEAVFLRRWGWRFVELGVLARGGQMSKKNGRKGRDL